MQDALAVLVAAEMRKMLKKELEPTAPLPFAESGVMQMSELERLQVRCWVLKTINTTWRHVGLSFESL